MSCALLPPLIIKEPEVDIILNALQNACVSIKSSNSIRKINIQIMSDIRHFLDIDSLDRENIA